MTAKPRRYNPEPTVMMKTRVVLKDVEVLERTTVFPVSEPTSIFQAPAAPARVARGSSPALPVLTPALEREVFQLARRVAMQGDLAAALRVLKSGVAQLTASPDTTVVFHNPTAPITEQSQALVAQVATTGERVFIGTAIVEPIGPAPAKAVLVLRRAAGHGAYGPLELAVVAEIAKAVNGILGHFQADDLAKQEQAARDAKTPFRREVLEERRKLSHAPGKLVQTPRTWTKLAFPTLLVLVAAVVTGAALVQVPTYSTGVAFIVVEGEQVSAPLPGGTVAEVLVDANAHVKVGDPLVRMHGQDEERDLANTEADYRAALASFLTNPGDDNARTALATLTNRRERSRQALDARTLKAPVAGVVGDVHVRAGQLLTPGTEVLRISPEDASPSVTALLPGFDRPRLQVGMEIQIELPGFRAKRATAVIDSIGTQVVGPEDARRAVGGAVSDAVMLNTTVVIVKAHLNDKTFSAEGKEFELHDGMNGKAEVRVATKSLLRTLLPSSEAE